MSIEDGRYQSSVSQLNFKLPEFNSNSLIEATVATIDDNFTAELAYVGDGLFKVLDPDEFQLSIQILSDPEMPNVPPASIAVIPEATYSAIDIDVSVLYHNGNIFYP